MPDLPNRRQRDFSQYDAMDDEQLRQILREDASKPEGEESDMELLLHVMEVLAKRRKKQNGERDPEAALESFKRNYQPAGTGSAGEKESGAHGVRWKRILVSAAACLALIICCSLTAKAFGYNVWDVIAKWTQETFHFGYVTQVTEPSAPEKEDMLSYTGLQELLLDYRISIPLAPTWIPDGYEECDVRAFETPKQRQFVVSYQHGNEMIKVWITDYLDSHPDQIEQSDSLIEIYTSAGVDYYIFNNEGLLRAAWIRDNYECYISGPLSIDELKVMIDSIEKG